jgi:hypothetical protein
VALVTGDLWTIHDINTGRVLGKKDEKESARMFLYSLKGLHLRGKDIYVVTGNARQRRQVEMVADIKAMGIPVVRDRRADEAILVLEGQPEEWEGFTDG